MMEWDIAGKVAVVTGAGSGIGKSAAVKLAEQGIKGLALVDRAAAVTEVAAQINARREGIAAAFVGDTIEREFRREVHDQVVARFGVPRICVPAAGITRDALAVKVNKQTGEVEMYPEETFRLVVEVNLIAPVYWAMEMVARIARDRLARKLGRWMPRQDDGSGEDIQGAVIFIGSVSSLGNKGQIAYAATKKGLEGAAKTLMAESMFHGVRCGVIHPGFTDTPMVRSMGEDLIKQHVLPATQLRRLIKPEEIADAICFMIGNPAVSGELWADAGWHPAP